MGQYTKEQIVERATELARMIAETQEVDFFKRAEAQINQNKKVQEIIETIKSLQKQAVNFQHYGKSEALKQVEDKIDKLQEELDSIPVVEDFKNSQIEVNDLLQLVAHTISNNVTNEIVVSTGGDLLAGETGSKLNNKSGCGCH